jgi:hypothetical protein
MDHYIENISNPISEGWYLGLGDLGFFLISAWNSQEDIYW